MLTRKKHLINAYFIAFLLVCIAIFLRNAHHFFIMPMYIETIAGVLRGLIYIFLFFAWCFFLRQRIIQIQVRRFLTVISILMVFWISLRILKYNIFNYTHIGRGLWYLYYIPMLFIPLLTLFVAISLGKPEKYHLPYWTNVLLGATFLLFIMVLTNDIHQNVFGFPMGLDSYENGEYTHLIGYYLIMGWIAICSLSAFIAMLVKCRIPYVKKKVFFPVIPMIILVLYAVLYLVKPSFIKLIAGDMTVTVCVLVAIILEACIQCGLIQSNNHYNELFECTSIHMRILDVNHNLVMTSTHEEMPSKDMLRRIENGPVMVGNGTRLCGSPIKNGYVVWSEDVSKMNEIITELVENSEYLSTRKTVLHKEVETSKREQQLIEQNRLYNRLINDNKEEYLVFSQLLKELEQTHNNEQEKNLTAKLAVVCTHIKRRTNLLFLSENGDQIEAMEVQFALEEWLSNLRLCGVKCHLYFSIHSTLSFNEIITLYDTYQWILYYTLDSLHSLFITANEMDGDIYFLLNLNCDYDLSGFSYQNIDIDDEGDGEWIIRISIPRGGVTE